jgi:16S rRNA (guanine(527)-N(7))-methyltransferase RsmG
MATTRHIPPQRHPSRAYLVELLHRAGIRPANDQIDRLWTFHRLLHEANRDRDLSRLVNFESVVVKHYVDSIFVTRLVRLPSPLLDIGTGAGFPGIPLKIMCPDLKLILAEARPRRVQFLERACKALGFRNTQVFPHKVVSRSFQQPVAGVITRALEDIDKTLLRTSGCTHPGTKFFFLKGPAVDPEIQEVARLYGSEFKLLADHRYHLPRTPHERRLVVFERAAPSRHVAADPEPADR